MVWQEGLFLLVYPGAVDRAPDCFDWIVSRLNRVLLTADREWSVVTINVLTKNTGQCCCTEIEVITGEGPDNSGRHE